MSVEAVQRAGGRVAVENHVHMLVPAVDAPPVSMAQLGKFFASVAADRAFRCISGSVAVSATELESLPLPSVADVLIALQSANLEAAFCHLYGIVDAPRSEAATPEEIGPEAQNGSCPDGSACAPAAPAISEGYSGAPSAHLS